VLRRSRIAQLGVFTAAAVPAGQLLLEYRGEVIRHAVADAREARYRRARRHGVYFFAVDRRGARR
jgi:SET domain-containing protein